MALRHPWANCNSCPLNSPDAVYVPSQTPHGLTPRLAVVGEAPGYQEAVYKRPFVGPSGKLLDQVLGHYGYKREEVMYTNVCLCRPEDNATPPKSAVNACRPRLIRELAKSGVSDIVALGGTAASVLVDGGGNISRLRVGPPKDVTTELTTQSEAHALRVIATWHPAYCLRNPDAFPTLVSDLGKLKDRNTSAWCPPEWRPVEDPDTTIQVLESLMGTKDCVVDIEVGIDKDESFDHPNEFDLLCIGIGYAPGRVVVLGQPGLADKRVLSQLRQFLRSTRIVAQNGKFDLAGLYPHLGGLEQWFDTMLASYTLDERPGHHSLGTLGIEKLGTPDWKFEIKKYIPKGGSYANVPKEILYRYCAYDVAVEWDLKEYFERRLEQESNSKDWPYPDRPYKSLRDVHDFLVKVSNQLMYPELNGIPVDREYNQQLTRSFLERLGKIEDRINLICETELNPRSPKQIREWLASKNVNVDSTNVDTLEPLLGRLSQKSRAYAFIETLLLHRRQQKLYGTYIKGIAKRTYRGRVYTTYLLHGSTSGRLASRNPNLQNIVRDKSIKRQFVVSKPENVFVHADFKQAEGRVVATLAKDEYLRGIFSDPTRDIFKELGKDLYNKTELTKDERVRVKAFFYGLAYGREAYSIAMEYGLSVRETQKYLDQFMQLLSATANWQRSVRSRVLSGSDLITPFGRRRRFWLITEENKKDVLNEALSFLPQSTSNDICLDAFVHLRPMLRGLGFVRLLIHDSITAECSREKATEVGDLLRQEMLAAGRRFTDYVPFSVDISTGSDWGALD
jgi:DNA polymerase I